MNVYRWFRQLRTRKRVYLDYAGAHPVRAAAARAHQMALVHCGNPGGIHEEGRRAAAVLEDSRARIARVFGVRAREVVFTSGGTEANNLAVLGTFERLRAAGRNPKDIHMVVSAIEHPSVLACFDYLEQHGVRVSRVAPNQNGVVDPASLREALTPETVFVSIGWANSEIGVVQPLAALVRVVREHEKTHRVSVVFHSDFGQAPLYRSASMPSLGVDLATLDAGKLGGVRGIGALFVRSLEPVAILYGGEQERGMRPGTAPVALAAAYAVAVEDMAADRAAETVRLAALREDMIAAIRRAPALAGVVVHGEAHSLPHIVHISVPRADTEYLALMLDALGFALATKSACREGEPSSHVVAALGGEHWEAEHTLRISMGSETTAREVRMFVRALAHSVSAMRTH